MSRSAHESHYSGGSVIISVIGLAVLVLLMVVVAALSDSAKRQDSAKGQVGSDQFVTECKADARASEPSIPV